MWFGRGQDANGARRTCFMTEDDIIGYADHYVQSTSRDTPWTFSRPVSPQRGWEQARIGVEKDNYWFTAAAFADSLKNGSCPGPTSSTRPRW